MNELVRWDPFKALAPFEDSLFAMPSLFRPASRMDVAENENAYLLAVELAGVKKQAIQVNVNENTVTVSAEIPEERDGDMQWLHRERTLGKFTRSITLPEAVDDEASEARFTDGVLYLTLKKKSVTQAKRLTIH